MIESSNVNYDTPFQRKHECIKLYNRFIAPATLGRLPSLLKCRFSHPFPSFCAHTAPTLDQSTPSAPPLRATTCSRATLNSRLYKHLLPPANQHNLGRLNSAVRKKRKETGTFGEPRDNRDSVRETTRTAKKVSMSTRTTDGGPPGVCAYERTETHPLSTCGQRGRTNARPVSTCGRSRWTRSPSVDAHDGENPPGVSLERRTDGRGPSQRHRQ